jgi:hypothetical protein
MRYPPLGCSDTVAYDRSLTRKEVHDELIVSYNFAGNATYSNNGCQAAIPVSSVFAGNDTSVCPSSYTLLV